MVRSNSGFAMSAVCACSRLVNEEGLFHAVLAVLKCACVFVRVGRRGMRVVQNLCCV